MPDVAAATAKFEQANKNDLALLRESTVPSIARSVLDLRKAIASIRSDPRLNGTAITQDTLSSRAKALAELDATEKYGAIAVQNIRSYLSQQTETKLDTQEAILDQLQKAAAARRIDLLLNQGIDAAEVIRRAAGDAMALAVLREDITFAAGDTREAQVRQESLLDQLDQSETPLMSASKQAARLLEAELQTGWANVQTSLSLARAEASGASNSTSGYPVGVRSILAGWAPGSTIRLAFTDPSGGLSAPATPAASGMTGVNLPNAPQQSQQQLDDDYMRNQNKI